MKKQKEIPSESCRQQIIDSLEGTKQHIILTGSIFGLPEAYLNEYAKQNNSIIVTTEMCEIRSQIKKMEEDYDFYIESCIAYSLCNIALSKGFEIEKLEKLKEQIKRQKDRFIIGLVRKYKTDYQKGILLKKVLEEIQMPWEWHIINFDKPVEEASMVQNSMYSYMNGTSAPAKVILTAYDESLKKKTNWNEFSVITIPDQICYEQIKKEVLLILNNLYPNLKHKNSLIQQCFDSQYFQLIYERNNYPASEFMAGFRSFCEIYSYLYSDDKMSDEEFIQNLLEAIMEKVYLKDVKDVSPRKKPKLYI